MNRSKSTVPPADLKLLHVFVAIYESQSLTAAGERLGHTQPAISRALRRLRQLLDDPLFVRTPSGMVPTDAARKLDGPLTQAFAIIGQALQQRARFDASTADRTFRVSMSDMSELYFLPPLLARIAKVAPQVRLEVSTVASESLSGAMRSGTVDLALGFIPNLGAGCISETLFWDEHVCMVRRFEQPPFELVLLRSESGWSAKWNDRPLYGRDRPLFVEGPRTAAGTKEQILHALPIDWLLQKAGEFPVLTERLSQIETLRARICCHAQIGSHIQNDLDDTIPLLGYLRNEFGNQFIRGGLVRICLTPLLKLCQNKLVIVWLKPNSQ